MIPRYARLEMERRWLVSTPPDLAGRPWRDIEDLYIDGGRMRLRAITHHPSAEREFKLGKKYERDDPFGGPIVTVYLTEAEHAALAGLPGARMDKRRYRIEHGPLVFCLDVFSGPLGGLILTEIEMETREAVLAVQPPPWAGVEVTEDERFAGGRLCRLRFADLA